MLPWVYENMLLILLAAPLLGVAIIAMLPKKYEEASAEIALTFSGFVLFMSLIIFGMLKNSAVTSFAVSLDRILFINSSIRLGVDGFSALMLAIVSLSVFIAVLLSKKKTGHFGRGLYVFLLLFECACSGFFMSRDILLLYLFMEQSVLWLGFLAVISSREARIGRFAAFMGISSAINLVTIVFLSLPAGSTDIDTIYGIQISAAVQLPLYCLMLVSTLIRSAVFPFHSWLEQFTKGCAGYIRFIIVTMLFLEGVYLFYLFLPPLSVAAVVVRPYVMWAVTFFILISAITSLSEKGLGDILSRVLMVYFGFALLGLVSITPQGFAGSGMLMSTIPLLMISVAVIFALFERRGINLSVSGCEGIFSKTPLFGAGFLFIVLALGFLPGLSEFPAYLMILMGLFKGGWVIALLALLSGVTISVSLIIAASSALTHDKSEEGRIPLLKIGDVVFIVPFVVVIILIGLFPDYVIRHVKDSTEVIWNIFSRY